MLVHSRTLSAPQDTVRAVRSPVEGANLAHEELSSALRTATPLRETFCILADLIHWLARRDRRRWPGKGVLACLRRSSRLRISDSKPRPTPHHIFSSASRSCERPREKMFSSSFTMSEQKHRQWTPYKHAAPTLRVAFALARPAARSARAS